MELTVNVVTPLGATDKIAISFEIKAPVDTEKQLQRGYNLTLKNVQ